MNSDEISSAVTKILIMVGSGVAAKYGVDGNTWIAVAGAVGTLAAFAYGVYQHWNMKKVPETAKVVS